MGIATFRLHPMQIVLKQIGINIIQRRFLHVVWHDVDNGTFYVQLNDELAQAVLRYKIDGNVLDMRSVTVPDKYRGQGLARLLAETAFTYAIMNDYYMYLGCEYLQKYYRTVKNFDFEERVIGPPHVHNADLTDLNLDIVYELPGPKNSKL